MDTFSHYWKSDFTPRIRKGYSSTGHLFTGWQKYRKSITSTNLFCLTQPLCLQSNNVTGRQKGQSTPGVHVERLQPTLGKKHPELTNRAGADGRSIGWVTDAANQNKTQKHHKTLPFSVSLPQFLVSYPRKWPRFTASSKYLMNKLQKCTTKEEYWFSRAIVKKKNQLNNYTCDNYICRKHIFVLKVFVLVTNNIVTSEIKGNSRRFVFLKFLNLELVDKKKRLIFNFSIAFNEKYQSQVHFMHQNVS